MSIGDVGGCGKGYASLYALILLLPRDVRECGQAAAVEEATASHVCGILKTSCLEEDEAVCIARVMLLDSLLPYRFWQGVGGRLIC
jgi:hypothetical protein